MFQDHIEDFFNETQKERNEGEGFSDDDMNTLWSVCVAIWALFALFGVFLGSTLAGKLGRRNTMLLNNALLLLATLLQSFSKVGKSYEMFIAGRLFMG